MAFLQRLYVPVNKQKYIGSKLPFARSSWELSFMEYFDNNPGIVEWGSEIISIPYIKPSDGKIHSYYPDFVVKYIDVNGSSQIEVIEVKPTAQTRPSRSKNQQRRLNETMVFAINNAKWRAAVKWCQQNGAKFRILTEKADITNQWLSNHCRDCVT